MSISQIETIVDSIIPVFPKSDHKYHKSLAERLSEAERLANLPRCNEEYKIGMMTYAAENCLKEIEAFEAANKRRRKMMIFVKRHVMRCAILVCAQEMEEADTGIKKAIRFRPYTMTEAALLRSIPCKPMPNYPVVVDMKQLLDEEVNARMAEWFAEAD